MREQNQKYMRVGGIKEKEKRKNVRKTERVCVCAWKRGRRDIQRMVIGRSKWHGMLHILVVVMHTSLAQTSLL